MKKVFIIIGIIFFIIFILACPYIINNITLSNFSKQLFSVSLPSDSILIEKKALCGKLIGNGDGMDFLAVMLIKSSKDLDELQEHFSVIKYKNARSFKGNGLDIVVQQASFELWINGDVLNNNIDFASLNNISDFSDLYFVILFDSDYFHFFDIRGV